jgi:hypothetical protein
MALRLTDCQATQKSIIVFFSDDVTAPGATGATYTVYNPAVSETPTNIDKSSGTTSPISYDVNHFATTLDLTKLTAPLTLKVENHILVSVTGIPVEEVPLAIGTVVKSELTIVNCVVTSDLVVVYFSEALDTAAGAADPNDPSNYTLFVAGGQIIQPTSANYDNTAQATFLQFPPDQLQPGQLVSITVVKVKSTTGTTIGNSGNNTFTTRVRGDGGNGGGNGTKKEVKEITESVEDAVAYPILTEQVSFPPSAGAAPVAGAAPTGLALGQSAAKAVTDVLGWKVNPSDPKGFIGALTQAFTLTEVQGHIEAAWNPRTYAVQTDLGGGITGAQASLYTRAKEALDQSLPLLDGLYPLDPDADPEYVKALREMARSQMTEIVKELGALGGPSVLRVNTYFGILLGQQNISFSPPTQPEFDPDKVGGTLGTLRDTYGIYFQKNSQSNPFSNSIADEQDITNFRVISDYMTSLLQSWISNGQFFLLGDPTQPAFFGTQLVLISRQFSVIAETVNEVRFAFDSVFIGPSERQTLLLVFRDSKKFPSIFLEDLLQEIVDFFTVEATGLLQDGGRISVTNNIVPVVSTFLGMVTEAKRPVNLKSLPDGFRTVRVQRALDDLRDQLSDLISLVQPVGQEVPPPLEEPAALQILSVSPVIAHSSSTKITSTTARIAITGAGFAPGATFTISPSPQPGAPTVSPAKSQTQFLNQNLLAAKITVTTRITYYPTAESVFSYSVLVTNLDGTQSTPLQDGLTITVIPA